jgi:hypothetical protein
MSLLSVKETTLRFGASPRLIDRLDALQRHRETGRIHLAPVAELVVLAFPNKLSLERGEGMGVTRAEGLSGTLAVILRG